MLNGLTQNSWIFTKMKINLQSFTQRLSHLTTLTTLIVGDWLTKLKNKLSKKESTQPPSQSEEIEEMHQELEEEAATLPSDFVTFYYDTDGQLKCTYNLTDPLSFALISANLLNGSLMAHFLPSIMTDMTPEERAIFSLNLDMQLLSALASRENNEPMVKPSEVFRDRER